MNINIARFILALVVGSGISLTAHAKAPTAPDQTHHAAGFEFSGSVFTPLFIDKLSDNPFDALEDSPRSAQQLEIDMRPADPVTPTHQNVDIASAQAVSHTPDSNSLSVGIWLFLGGIWIIGTLVHHRHTIHTH